MRNSDASADDNSTESFLQIRHFDWLCRRIQEFLSCGDGSFRLVLKEGMWNRKTPNYVVGDTVFQTLWNGGAYNAKYNWCPNPLYTARTLGRPTCISENIHTRQR